MSSRVSGRFFRRPFAFSRSFLAYTLGRSTIEAGEIIIHRQADFFHRLRSNSFYGLKLFRGHISQRFDGCNTRGAELLH